MWKKKERKKKIKYIVFQAQKGLPNVHALLPLVLLLCSLKRAMTILCAFYVYIDWCIACVVYRTHIAHEKQQHTSSNHRAVSLFFFTAKLAWWFAKQPHLNSHFSLCWFIRYFGWNNSSVPKKKYSVLFSAVSASWENETFFEIFIRKQQTNSCVNPLFYYERKSFNYCHFNLSCSDRQFRTTPVQSTIFIVQPQVCCHLSVISGKVSTFISSQGQCIKTLHILPWPNLYVKSHCELLSFSFIFNNFQPFCLNVHRTTFTTSNIR